MLAERLAESTDAAAIRYRTETLRSSTVFAIKGAAAEVLKAGDLLIRSLVRLSQLRPGASDLERAYQSSLRQSAGSTLEPRLLEDEALSAMLPNTVFTLTPVDRSRPMPKAEAVVARMRTLAAAPLQLILAGDVSADDAKEILKSAGPRQRDSRPRAPRPQLPNGLRRVNKELSLIAEGYWVQATDSPQQLAQMLIAEAWLRDRAAANLRNKERLLEEPYRVVGGGQAAASYLILICAGRSELGGELESAAEEVMAQLKLSPPTGEAYESVRARAYGALLVALGSADSGAERLADLALARGRPAGTTEIFDHIAAASEDEFAEFLTSLVRQDHAFSLRWGPEE
jgi:hypothetical protein